MRMSLVRYVSRIMLVCMTCLPIHARAGLIGTGETVSSALAAREAVGRFVERTEVALQLQAFGLGPDAARDRVAALTDAEVASLAGRVGGLPAGAEFAIGTVGAILIVIFLVYLLGREVLFPPPR